jgi:hypothetical protein
MSVSRYKVLIEKSVSAAISAIEVYNKPDFKYREENFSILMINAWEILLKAKILKDNNNKLNSIYIQWKKETKWWKPSKRFYAKLNRTWNPMTISIIDALWKIKLDKTLKENIELLIEIRDNSIHYINKDSSLDKKILEIWTSTLKSYLTCCNEWFNYDLSKYNFFLMPMSFFHTFEAESFSINNSSKQVESLKKHILDIETSFPSNESNNHNISLILETTYKKSSSWFWAEFDKNSVVGMTIDTEEKFQKKYPYDYKQLVNKLLKDYPNFKRWKEFHWYMKKLKEDEKYHWIRYLNFDTKTWSNKGYYSSEIFKEFKKIYK